MQNYKTNSMIKFIVTAILTIVLAFGFILPASTILSNIQRYEAMTVKAATGQLQVTGIKKSYNLGDTIELPKLSGEGEIIVKDPKGNKIDPVDASTKYTVVANYAGDYTVEYRDGNTTTGEIVISVKASTPSFNFNTADKKIIPSEIAPNTKVVFPNPEILDEDGEVIEDASATLVVKMANGSVVECQTETDSTSGKQYSYYTFTQEGVYSVVYSYKGQGYNYIDKKYTIEVTEGYESDVDLTFTLDESLPTSLVQGVETTLPTVTGKDKNNNNATVDVYTTVEVEYLNGNTYEPVTVTDYKFTPSKAGTYRIKYTVTDFYGNTYQKVYDPIENVRDTQAPTIQIVENYTVEEDGSVTQDTIDALVDAKDSIPSIVATGTTVTLPAIFATDNVASFKDLSLRRLVKQGTDQIANLDDTSVTEYANNKINESVQYTFDKEGTYTIIYRASDDLHTTADSLYSFTIVVKEGFTDNIAPTITVKDFVTDENGATIDRAEPGETIRIVKPTVVDYEDPEDASNRNTNDTRPTLQVFAQINSGEQVELALSDEGDYYEYTIPEDASGELNIIYKAKDCSGNIGNGTNTNGLVKTLGIINTNETTAPTITNVQSDLGEKDQYTTVDLSGGVDSLIAVSDTEDTDVMLKVMITCDGEIVDDALTMTTITTKEGNGSTKTIAKADFVANKAGAYVVNYIAYDHAGNYTVQSTTFTVASKATPILSVNNYSSEMELGSAYIPTANVYIDGKLDETAVITTEVQGDINQIGTVKVTYKATGSNGVKAEDVVISISVKDTTKPTIVLDGEVPEYVDLEKDAEDDSLYKEITVPGFTATDSGSKIDKSKYKITVKNKNDVEVASVNDANGLTFRPTGNGKYTVEYSATDNAGNVITQTYTINVGDVVRPTLTIENEPATTAKLKNGSYSLKIDTSKISIVDDVDGELSVDDYLSVTVTNSSGTAIEADEDTSYVFTLTEAGEYTITITAEDKAGNTRTETYKLDLSAEDNGASTTTEVLGTILLVIAILVLIGVVWYFVKPAPKAKKDNKKEVSSKNKENK